jgi:hypothetical protein
VADNVTLPATGAGDATIPVRTSESSGGKQIQHVRLDLGAGAAEAQATGTVPVSGTLTVAGSVTAAQPAATTTTVNARQTVPTTANGTEILPADGARKGLAVMPEAAMHISFGEDTTTSHFQVQAFQVFQPPVGVNITGQVKGLSAAGSITVNVLAW